MNFIKLQTHYLSLKSARPNTQIISTRLHSTALRSIAEKGDKNDD